MIAYLTERTRIIDETLDRLLPPATTSPVTLHEAMRYSLFAGGKRLRPALCLAASEACGGSVEAALPMAAAVECLHTYTLIHDDLPCMDDDDFAGAARPATKCMARSGGAGRRRPPHTGL
ncbi:MAG: polyprenyl synthetase family protein [Verrucomicrobiales bacterium]